MPTGSDMARMRQDLATARRRVLAVCARATQKALQQATDAGYQERVDVNGKPYKPAADGSLPPMERSGDLRRAYRYPIADDSLSVKIIERTTYGQYLRDSTPKMDARQHIPKPEERLPPRYDRAVSEGQAKAVAAMRGP